MSGRLRDAWGGYALSPDPALSFWEIELRHWDMMFQAGVASHRCGEPVRSPTDAPRPARADRQHHVDPLQAARPCLLRGRQSGTNKLTEQMAEDLRPLGIAAVAVSPGFMRGERMNLSPERAAMTESTQFVGRAVAALAADAGVLRRSGSVLTTPELARDYGFEDNDGSVESPWWREYLADG